MTTQRCKISRTRDEQSSRQLGGVLTIAWLVSSQFRLATVNLKRTLGTLHNSKTHTAKIPPAMQYAASSPGMRQWSHPHIATNVGSQDSLESEPARCQIMRTELKQAQDFTLEKAQFGAISKLRDPREFVGMTPSVCIASHWYDNNLPLALNPWKFDAQVEWSGELQLLVYTPRVCIKYTYGYS